MTLTGQRLTVEQSFALARSRNRLGLVPFVPAGFPDLPSTAAALGAFQSAGATVIEVGFPFSDPIADGPIIQEAFVEALSHHIRITDVLATVAEARAKVLIPIVGMLSYSLVFRYGVAKFIKNAKEAGLSGLILPDLPPPEAQRICGAIREGGLDTILLVAPTTTAQRRAEIVKLSSGFVYYLSVSGVTGERDRLPDDVERNVRELKQMTDVPVCVGFGVSQPKHMAQLQGVADGAIVGSAIVRRMRTLRDKGPAAIAEALEAYARELLAAGEPASASKQS